MEMDEADINEMMESGLNLVMKEVNECKADEIDEIWEELVWLRKRGFWSQIDSRIGSGREGFVYHAIGPAPEHRELAIKVFTCPVTDLISRFDCNHKDYDPLWVDFFMRPLSERYTYRMMKIFGIPCPSPVVDETHVVIAQFIGKDGVPAPTLSVASAQLSKAQLFECFKEMISIMRTLCLKCELVHGDLSETNVLYHQGHLYVIDASQSASTDHIWAPILLNNDCCRVLKFFETNSIPVMPAHVLYRLVSDKSITDETFNNCLEEISLDTSATERWIKLFEETRADTVLPEYNVGFAKIQEQRRAEVERRLALYNNLSWSWIDDEEDESVSWIDDEDESGFSSAVIGQKRGRESPPPPPGEEDKNPQGILTTALCNF